MKGQALSVTGLIDCSTSTSQLVAKLLASVIFTNNAVEVMAERPESGQVISLCGRDLDISSVGE